MQLSQCKDGSGRGKYLRMTVCLLRQLWVVTEDSNEIAQREHRRQPGSTETLCCGRGGGELLQLNRIRRKTQRSKEIRSESPQTLTSIFSFSEKPNQSLFHTKALRCYKKKNAKLSFPPAPQPSIMKRKE